MASMDGRPISPRDESSGDDRLPCRPRARRRRRGHVAICPSHGGGALLTEKECPARERIGDKRRLLGHARRLIAHDAIECVPMIDWIARIPNRRYAPTDLSVARRDPLGRARDVRDVRKPTLTRRDVLDALLSRRRSAHRLPARFCLRRGGWHDTRCLCVPVGARGRTRTHYSTGAHFFVTSLDASAGSAGLAKKRRRGEETKGPARCHSSGNMLEKKVDLL